ncbi:MAG: hypothetical protein ACFFB2_18080 [Promethearchaeota archaeon]
MRLVTFIGSITTGIVTEVLMINVGKWSVIYIMVLIDIFLRFVCGLAFFFVEEPVKPD